MRCSPSLSLASPVSQYTHTHIHKMSHHTYSFNTAITVIKSLSDVFCLIYSRDVHMRNRAYPTEICATQFIQFGTIEVSSVARSEFYYITEEISLFGECLSNSGTKGKRSEFSKSLLLNGWSELKMVVVPNIYGP